MNVKPYTKVANVKKGVIDTKSTLIPAKRNPITNLPSHQVTSNTYNRFLTKSSFYIPSVHVDPVIGSKELEIESKIQFSRVSHTQTLNNFENEKSSWICTRVSRQTTSNLKNEQSSSICTQSTNSPANDRSSPIRTPLQENNSLEIEHDILSPSVHSNLDFSPHMKKRVTDSTMSENLSPLPKFLQK